MKKRLISLIAISVLIAVLCCSLAACDFGSVGATGESAYEIAVRNGYVGTETEWLASLAGENGENGEDGASVNRGYSAYEIAVQQGFEGNEQEWLASLVGERGETSVTDTAEAVNKALRSIVSIFCSFNYTTTNPRTEQESTSTKQSAGAGVIFRDDKTTGTAYIITNYHVVYDKSSDEYTSHGGISQTIKVFLYGMECGSEYGYDELDLSIPATYIGGSMTYDIAVLKITSDRYKNSASTATAIADSNRIVVGETVSAIGNPDADGISATMGVISVDSESITMTGADEETEIQFRVMRIDAAVNSGNSGGGLFNNQGELVGIVNAKIMTTDVENIGYAIPSTLALNVAQNLIRNCEGTDNTGVSRCLLGITIEIADSYAYYNTNDKTTQIIQTVKIREISADSIVAGQLEVDDKLISYTYDGGDEIAITRLYTLVDACLTFEKDKTLILKYNRDGVISTVNITLSVLQSVV